MRSLAVALFTPLLLITSGRDVRAQSKPAQTPEITATSPQLEGRAQPVTGDDLRILEKALDLLKNEAAWNPKDDRECTDDEASGQRSLFCALQKACIDVLIDAGGTTRYNAPGVLEVLRHQHDHLAEQLETDSTLKHRRFPELDCGNTGGRRLLLQGATLLHVAVELGNVEGARLLLDRGADVNVRATVDDAGVGGQTAIFHAVTQFDDRGLPMTQLLVERGADLRVRVKLPGHYERPEEVIDYTPLGYALRFQSESRSEGRTIAFLRERGAIE